MKTLYFDCFAGASGNMVLGAIIALGVDELALERQLRRLPIPDFELVIDRVDRSGISAVHVEVKVPHEHAHRHLADIIEIIEKSELSETIKERAKAIFTRLAEAEAKVHGITVEEVHFHEVGAMDAIIDVVGACIGFEMLGIERFSCSRVHVGSGFAKMAHGTFPVPPPAVTELLTGVPIYSTEIEGELITPTGAAIIATLCTSYGEIRDMVISGSAYGAGTREYSGFPNALRLIVGESVPAGAPDTEGNTDLLLLLETNIDDITPQILGYVMDRAFQAGALDCWFTPIYMKKNRPATTVSILCDREKKDEMHQLLYSETSTLGIRTTTVRRNCLPRETISVSTDFGNIDVKLASLDGVLVNAKPEYDQLRDAAMKANRPLKEVEQEVLDRVNKHKSSHMKAEVKH